MAIKSVTLNYNGHYGALDYNEETKELTVTIKGETQIEQKVMDFLRHRIRWKSLLTPVLIISKSGPSLPETVGRTASRY